MRQPAAVGHAPCCRYPRAPARRGRGRLLRPIGSRRSIPNNRLQIITRDLYCRVGQAQDGGSGRPMACGSTMLDVPKSLLVVTSLAVAAGAAVSLGYVWHGVPWEARPAARTMVDAAPAHETVGLAELPGLDRSLNADITPAFDIVRIEPGGDAVIAGRTAPGAIVELHRDG